jgi:hypothetical protein
MCTNLSTQFEELVNQFIPSDTSWRGWARMVFHQPLIPVLPVARELISKTKWIGSKGSRMDAHGHSDSSKSAQAKTNEAKLSTILLSKRSPSPYREPRRVLHRKADSSSSFASSPMTSEPEPMDSEDCDSHDNKTLSARKARPRVFSIFRHGSPSGSTASSRSSTRSSNASNV